MIDSAKEGKTTAMGSMIEVNDTLRISKQQGFPAWLNLATHLKIPYKLADVEGKVFSFRSKPAIRVFQQPPVRNFLVEDLGGKWVYWGQCFVLEIVHNYEKKETSGKFKIICLNTPEEMKQAFALIDRVPEHNYFPGR